MTDAYCPMIHGGLQINFKHKQDKLFVNHCCLRSDLWAADNSIWDKEKFIPLRDLNNTNKWDPGCWQCHSNESANIPSFRLGMLDKFGIRKDLSGPLRIDLMFDIGCNLACRTCGPGSSTLWQQHLKQNNIPFPFAVPAAQSRVSEVLEILKTLDLSNLEMLVFCGGETLLGQGYWQVAELLAELDPRAKQKLQLSFQTNGTQEIHEKNYKTIEKFQLVKLNISLDGIGKKFEYLRWPASWDQVTNNIHSIVENAPANMMLLVEETISIFNWFYMHELDEWKQKNFSHNRLGDITNHSRHLAHGKFNINNVTTEYVDAMRSSPFRNLLPSTWEENPEEIKKMIASIQQFDKIRAEDWTVTFPEVAEFYSRYL